MEKLPRPVTPGDEHRGRSSASPAPAVAFPPVIDPRLTRRLRGVAVLAVGGALALAVWFQRGTVLAALGELRAMSAVAVALLLALTVAERVSRADVVRRLLGTVTFGRALTIHDVGAATSKGVPLGGPLATALRWSIARDARVPTTHFASMLVAYGVVTTFVTWLLPLAVVVADTTTRQPTRADIALIAVCAAVVAASAAFWVVVLRSERIGDWVAARVHRLWQRVARRFPAAAGHDPAAGLLTVRASLRTVARRPAGLFGRVAIAQSCSALILLVALRGLGVGAELGTSEFLRVYFVVTLLSSFVPVPGGVGVVEAGLTAALVAAGVDSSTALAGVLVYRVATYVVPIAAGAALYVGWRIRVRSRAAAERPTGGDHGPGVSPTPVRSLT